jgi:TIR domain-containing protein
MSKPKIFIASAPADQDWVRPFARALEDEGAAVWIDQEHLRAGDFPSAALERALRGSDLVICVYTPELATRSNVFFEWGAALGLGKRVVPVVPSDFDAGTFPLPLRTRKFLHRASPEETARRLLAETAA